ncbi:MAG: hypothetical protein AB1403_07640 [Candidatus Riflebacteria bacterium]
MKLRFVLFVLSLVLLPLSLQAQIEKEFPADEPMLVISCEKGRNGQIMRFTELAKKLNFVREVIGGNEELRQRISELSLDDNWKNWSKSKVSVNAKNKELSIRYVSEEDQNRPEEFFDVPSIPSIIQISHGYYFFWSERNGIEIERKRVNINSDDCSVYFPRE